jgi:N6-adenosine-specific RNA methylase IME4
MPRARQYASNADRQRAYRDRVRQRNGGALRIVVPAERFRCIMADPPWPARDQGSRIAPAHAGHYQVMSISSIIGLGDQVRAWAEKDCHLWLCAPNYIVLDGTAAIVAQMWGFRPKQQCTWRKNKIGMGHWMRNTTEQVILCVRGQLKPLKKNVRTDFDGPVGRHSEKPDELYRHIELVSPGPRLEMFARRARPGWMSYGDQAPSSTRIR